MRSRLAEGGALAMRLSLVSSNAARHDAAFFVIVETKIEFLLTSPGGGVDNTARRKPPGWYARIGSRVRLLSPPPHCAAAHQRHHHRDWPDRDKHRHHNGVRNPSHGLDISRPNQVYVRQRSPWEWTMW